MKREPLFVEVSNKLIALIQEKYPPGTKIPIEPELMEMFGVSRTTIRSAISSLCSRNILEIRRGDGTYVTNTPGVADDPLGIQFLDPDRVAQEIAEMSWLIQPAAAKMAAARATADDIERLENAIKSLADGWLLFQQNLIDYTELRARDSRFHSTIIRSSHNHIMARMDNVLAEATASYSEHSNIEVIKDSLEYHSRILEAIRNRNEKLASELMTEHLNHVHDAFTEAK